MLPYSLGSSLASMPSEMSSSLTSFYLMLTPTCDCSQRPGSSATGRNAGRTLHARSTSFARASPYRRSASVRGFHERLHVFSEADDPPGLMMLMADHSPRSTQILFPLIAGVGLGMLFHAPYQVFTRALRRKEVASGTSAFFLVRFTGATVGIVSFFPSLYKNVFQC